MEFEEIKRIYRQKRKEFHPDALISKGLPEELIERIIKTGSNPNDLILDPFMGSGTTGVVCKREGLDFIGMEINPKHLETAQKRIDKVILLDQFESIIDWDWKKK